jgi:hypothetical protein
MLAGPIPLNTKRFNIGSDDQFTGVGVGDGVAVGLGEGLGVGDGDGSWALTAIVAIAIAKDRTTSRIKAKLRRGLASMGASFRVVLVNAETRQVCLVVVSWIAATQKQGVAYRNGRVFGKNRSYLPLHRRALGFLSSVTNPCDILRAPRSPFPLRRRRKMTQKEQRIVVIPAGMELSESEKDKIRVLLQGETVDTIQGTRAEIAFAKEEMKLKDKEEVAKVKEQPVEKIKEPKA